MKRFGPFQISSVNGGYFGLDGGAMFGIVPRPLWERSIAPDAKNRIRLAARCLLIIDERGASPRRILVDTGVGDKFNDKEMKIFDIDLPEGGLVGSVASLGFGPEEITDVIITHLHFDHVGGATQLDPSGDYRPTFPNATFHVQQRMWTWAQHPTEKDSGSFRRNTYEALASSGCLHFLNGSTEIVPGLNLILSEGHTVGQQLPLLDGGADGKLLFCGDLIPTRSHIHLPWIMGYDLHPLTTLEEKKLVLTQALEDDWTLFFDHDPEVAACRLATHKGHAVAGDTVEI